MSCTTMSAMTMFIDILVNKLVVTGTAGFRESKLVSLIFPSGQKDFLVTALKKSTPLFPLIVPWIQGDIPDSGCSDARQRPFLGGPLD